MTLTLHASKWVGRYVLHDNTDHQTRLQYACLGEFDAPETFPWIAGSPLGLSLTRISAARLRPRGKPSSQPGIPPSAAMSRSGMAQLGLDCPHSTLGRSMPPARGCIRDGLRGCPDGSTRSWQAVQAVWPLGHSSPSRSKPGKHVPRKKAR